MNLRYPTFFALFGLAALFGAGCSDAATPQDNATPTEEDASVTDPYEGWKTIESGDVISLRVPADCSGEPAAGSIYVTCTSEGEEAVMVVSSDGVSVRVRAGDIPWDKWDKVIESIKVLAPLERTVTITITDPSDTSGQ